MLSHTSNRDIASYEPETEVEVAEAGEVAVNPGGLVTIITELAVGVNAATALTSAVIVAKCATTAG